MFKGFPCNTDKNEKDVAVGEEDTEDVVEDKMGNWPEGKCLFNSDVDCEKFLVHYIFELHGKEQDAVCGDHQGNS